jgi:hypothetical protein
MFWWKLMGGAAALALLAGCESFNGPSLDYTAPRVTGRVVAEASGQPVAYAQVGRRLWAWRKGTGEFLKGGEEMVLRQDYVRTGADGSFVLPSRQVALLFSWGEVPLNLQLTVQHGGYLAWQTNFPTLALDTNSAKLELNAGEVRLKTADGKK